MISKHLRSSGDQKNRLHWNQVLVEWSVDDPSVLYGLLLEFTPTPAKDPLCVYDVQCGARMQASIGTTKMRSINIIALKLISGRPPPGV